LDPTWDLECILPKLLCTAASSIKIATKCDKILRYRGRGEAYRFVQAKRKNSCICRDNLLSESGDFSQVKYFCSCTIIHSFKTFKDSKKEFILCTPSRLSDLEEFTEQVCDLDVFHWPSYRFKSNLMPYLHPKIEDYCFFKNCPLTGLPSIRGRLFRWRSKYAELIANSRQSDHRFQTFELNIEF
jgi:hypothetical protein